MLFLFFSYSGLRPETHSLFVKREAKTFKKDFFKFLIQSAEVKIGKELKMPVLFSVEKRTKKDFKWLF
jgi:hypothetical protein